MLLTPEEARALLPRLGSKRMEIPTVDESQNTHQDSHKTPQKCVVVYVNPEHLWYTVQFENGTRESYKVPKTKTMKRVTR